MGLEDHGFREKARQIKNATHIINKAYKTSVEIPSVALRKDFIFIIISPRVNLTAAAHYLLMSGQ